jgi:Zn-dependent M28 family amino/carboxypeptidase
VKVDNAAAAGAVGVIIFNEGQAGRTDVINGTLDPPQAAIPAVGATFAVGLEIYNLTQAGPVTVRLAVTAHVERKTTENIIADSWTGRTDRTVVVGAHLDSVLEGPGINDNGSGSSVILEIALQMAELGIEPTNRVRFTFWGAEESGLIGSQYYVDSLSKREVKDIALYLNFDMVGSPNYVRFVYDGDGSAFGIKGPTGSGRIEDVFTEFFSSQGLASEPTAFDGRSDYEAFINAGIPAGGLFTGAEGVKTAEQAAVYGGVAGAAYDPCYHQACDSLTPVADGAPAALYAQLAAAYGEDLVGNVNVRALKEMADATAHATLLFAMTTSAVGGTGQASGQAEKKAFKGHRLQR